MIKRLLFTLVIAGALSAKAQTNIISTNPLAESIMLGNYNPADYMPSVVLNHPDTIVRGINSRVSPDTLKRYLEILSAFENRNTGSDTISATRGIGAARKWVYSKFEGYSALNENRFIPSYLQFNLNVCGITRHKNIFAVLPGSDTSDKSIIIIEGHIDSRCENVCDTACLAEGMEDNGSGTSLVMELARIMGRYSYKHTIVFMATTGEEQGKHGANAFAIYAKNKGIAIKAVLNNDVIGGVICGKTSSAPSCPGFNHIDSTQVRLFSDGSYNSPHKGLARFIKLEYKEEALPLVKVPMAITIMSAEDRTGRGGDHQPFRIKGYPAMRFTSANEHGDASNGTGYTDRQHTIRDILGLDTDSNLVLDTFFVDFNYLARNTVINGTAATMAGIGPKTPDFVLTTPGANELTVEVTKETQYPAYRIGLRSLGNDWDTVYTFSGSLKHTFTVPDTGIVYSVSVASVDGNSVESLFSGEYKLKANSINELRATNGVELMQNKPNPADEATTISVLVTEQMNYKNAFIVITDLNGKEVSRMAIELQEGMNEVLYEHGYNVTGTYIYTLVVDNEPLYSKKMMFIN